MTFTQAQEQARLVAEGRLPKWAQDELKLLRMRLSEAQDLIASFSGDIPVDAPCIVLNTFSPDHEVRLPLQDVRVQLGRKTSLGPVRFVDIAPYMEGRSNNYGTANGMVRVSTSQSMRVVPHVSNVISIAEEG